MSSHKQVYIGPYMVVTADPESTKTVEVKSSIFACVNPSCDKYKKSVGSLLGQKFCGTCGGKRENVDTTTILPVDPMDVLNEDRFIDKFFQPSHEPDGVCIPNQWSSDHIRVDENGGEYDMSDYSAKHYIDWMKEKYSEVIDAISAVGNVSLRFGVIIYFD